MLLKLKLSRAHSQPQASSLGMSKDQHKRKIPEMSKKKKKSEREKGSMPCDLVKFLTFVLVYESVVPALFVKVKYVRQCGCTATHY